MLSLFPTLHAPNVHPTLHPSSAVRLLIHRQIKSDLLSSPGRTIKMVAIGVRDMISVSDSIALFDWHDSLICGWNDSVVSL
jgi:hypothetical protein